ncbi:MULTISPECIES: aminotransferase class I/II-fold pyridoxal phosphate-dependent enzyme [unclassified Bradyrhizobium]|uniref:aminotransferase class I/II-fold pyridoxal phosphate-dependent enzyme n=1 Tax=unclassified Bradyrhizobium TaxID=2631580 RepID=UPI00339A8246
MSSVIAAKSASYVAGLDALKEDDRLRGIMPRIGTDFSSSDDLALVSAPRMEKAMLTALESGTPIGAGGSRLLRDNCAVFGGGYFANFPVLTRLPQRHNLLVIESLVHASTHEAARAGRSAFTICAHKGGEAIESEIRDWRAAGGAGQVWIVVESLHIMDGVSAPVEDSLTIADRHDAFLVVGEVHGEALLTLQAGRSANSAWRNLSRSSIGEIVARGERSPSNSQILPYIVGENARAMRLASALHARGFDIRGIRPQTVPGGTLRLRISLTLNVGEEEVRAMHDVLDVLADETRGGSR